MAELPELVYLDTCIFIELLQRQDPKRLDACDAIHHLAKNEKLIIVTSSLTIVETNKLPELSILPTEQSRKILDFFENPYITIRPVDRGIAEYAHELTVSHGLMPADAIHVATAIRRRASVLYTYDSVKKRRKGLLRHNLKIGSPPLRIEIPPDPLKGTLFDETKISKNAKADAATDDK